MYAGRVINNRSSSTSKRSRSVRSSQSGYTLLEVVLASFVMVFGLSSSIIAMQGGFRQVELARGTTVASQILQSEIERLRMLNWTAIAALPATESIDLTTTFSANAALAARYLVTRTAVADTVRPTDVKNIKVSVTWKSFDGVFHTRSLTSIYAKNGLYDYYYSISHP